MDPYTSSNSSTKVPFATNSDDDEQTQMPFPSISSKKQKENATPSLSLNTRSGRSFTLAASFDNPSNNDSVSPTSSPLDNVDLSDKPYPSRNRDTRNPNASIQDSNPRTRLRRAASSVTADSWGLHSVPTLLSDFRKHTSHTQRERSSIASPLATRTPQSPFAGGSNIFDLAFSGSKSNQATPKIEQSETFPSKSETEKTFHDEKECHEDHNHSHNHSHSYTNDHSHSHQHEHGHSHSHPHQTEHSNECYPESSYKGEPYQTSYSLSNESQEFYQPPSLIERVPALISLPTSLLALDFLCLKLSSDSQIVHSFLSVSLVTGSLMLSAGLLTLIMNRQTTPTQHQFNKNDVKNTFILAMGSAALFGACSQLGSVKTSLIMAVIFNGPYPFFRLWNPAAIGYIAVMFVIDILRSPSGENALDPSISQIAIGYICLAISGYCLHRPAVTYSGVVSLLLGGIFLAPSLASSSTTFTVDVISLIAICSGSLGVFMLSKRDMIPTRFNPMISTLLSISLERSVEIKGTIPYHEALIDAFFAVATFILPPDTLYPRSANLFDPNSPPESIQNWGVIDSILAHSDTKNIFYFLLLNFSFMLIQLLYSILSHSLGLLSDSIHMFFDCLALFVGLIASILSKFPPSSRFPYGFGKVETVSGFTNGFLLIGISLGVIAEAIERMSTPVELEKTKELLIVSVLGLLVNVVGIFAFNHGHSHSHGGGSGHSHSHSLNLSSSHSHEHSHSHGHDHEHSREESEHSHVNHSDAEENENMRGIFLHIVADTLGSVGVIISTLLIHYFGWEGFDPLASILIAVLIFMSSVPLITSSAKTLLLSLNDNQEYNIRNILSDISIMPGVAGYTVPRFWADGSTIRGVIHVQVQPNFDTRQVKARVERKLDQNGVKAFVQTEPDGSSCWCKKK